MNSFLKKAIQNQTKFKIKPALILTGRGGVGEGVNVNYCGIADDNGFEKLTNINFTIKNKNGGKYDYYHYDDGKWLEDFAKLFDLDINSFF
jgi:hypothetical protein